MHLPPQAAGPDRSQFSYNMQKQPPEKPRSSAELKPQSPPLITEKRGRPRPKGGNNIAFNDGCCNYSSSSLWVELRSVVWYTLVSGPVAR
ncbi:replication protein [Salmonella enterica]|nr:replication protein [Salmonella enterica]